MNMIKKTLASVSALFLFVNLNGCQMLDSVNAMIDNTNDLVDNVSKLGSTDSEIAQPANAPEENLPDVNGLKYASYWQVCEDFHKSSVYAEKKYYGKYYVKAEGRFTGDSWFFVQNADEIVFNRVNTGKANKLDAPLEHFYNLTIHNFNDKKYIESLANKYMNYKGNEPFIASTGIVVINTVKIGSEYTAISRVSGGKLSSKNYYSCQISNRKNALF